MNKRDFTVETYENLLLQLKDKGYEFKTFEQYMLSPDAEGKMIILRHDVDDKHLNSLRFAELQHKLAVKGTYYFRMIPQSYNKETVLRIHDMGHEVGYHYETMDTSGGDTDKAYDEFCGNLAKMRELVPVKTVCMHGSPMSKFDNRDLWKKYDYKSLGIIGEPYFDMNFNEVFYLTDTGRKWDGDKVSIRDKAMNSTGAKTLPVARHKYHSTFDIISDLRINNFPGAVMMNFHPQRWTDDRAEWYKELFTQSIKNQVKRVLVFLKNRR